MIKIYDNNNDFLNHYEKFLMQDEIKNGLMIGIARRSNDADAYFVSSEIEERIILGVLAGKNLIISANTFKDDVYLELVKHMENIPHPGIIGEKEVAEAYNKAYKRLLETEMVVEMNQRIYVCKQVVSKTNISGVVRLANENDYNNLAIWVNDFVQEIEGKTLIDESNKTLRRLMDSKTLYVLEHNNKLLSMAARTRPMDNSETISYVYTPLNLRKHGYATMLVEALTKIILNEKEMVTLYTDLSNSTSNSIYLKIGYKPYCDSLVLVKQ